MDLLRDAADVLRAEQPGLDVPPATLTAMLAGLMAYLAAELDFPDDNRRNPLIAAD